MGAYYLVLVLSYMACFVAGGIADMISVLDHGAVGDGVYDDSNALTAAWRDACGKGATMLIPAGKTYVVGPIVLAGPCKSQVHVQINGNIVAPGQVWKRSSSDPWINFNDVPGGIIVDGDGQIDGNGQVWWTCRANRQCSDAPKALAFDNCNNVQLSGLKFTNSPMMHIRINKCDGVHISGVTITAPGDSPNTDGIHIEKSQQVRILDSSIGTGDDCISIGTGTSNVNISRINCGPGHGISVGSLGAKGSRASVNQIHVSDCNLTKTTNGVRIKTWPGGSGIAKDITFTNINFMAVENPVIIDQFYCNHGRDCNGGSAVQVQDVHYIGLKGSTTSVHGIILNCSSLAPCSGIDMERLNIQTITGSHTKGFCVNARGTKREPVNPDISCLSL